MRTLALLTLVFLGCSKPLETRQTPAKTVVKVDSVTILQDNVKANAAYICPMGPECGYSDMPGKCSGCGMEMRPNKKFAK